MRPNFLTSCLEDIEAIRSYHAGFSAVTAQRFVDTIFAKVEQLESFPELGRMVPELQNPAVPHHLSTTGRRSY
ncbi:type II toxin-antitoxin system RelE/ParE family toxin [Hymenobacter bucti]|uniref:Type II toxin-antitoxin system RelE/ParE family toxin n=1 Tax=Hymenobacter bucti TaxID=1844114 RepID=A0ABW4QUZ3_9BACT